MNPVRLARLVLWSTLTLVGAALTLGSGFLIIRGPLLGGEVLDPGPLLISAGVFVVGVIALALASTKLVRMYFG